MTQPATRRRRLRLAAAIVRWVVLVAVLAVAVAFKNGVVTVQPGLQSDIFHDALLGIEHVL